MTIKIIAKNLGYQKMVHAFYDDQSGVSITVTLNADNKFVSMFSGPQTPCEVSQISELLAYVNSQLNTLVFKVPT
jgi:hypothetical protein